MWPKIAGVFVWILHYGFLYDTIWTLPLSLPCPKGTAACGRPSVSPISMRIIGGQPAVRGSWPWMVSLRQNNFTKCGGALISEDLVLTATHCFLGELNETSIWTASVGKYRRNRVERGEKTVKVSKIVTHAEFNIQTVANDIALVLLAEPLVFSDVIGPICIPRSNQGVKDGEMCLLAGWGSTRGTSDFNALNQVNLPIVPDATCSRPDWYGADFSQPDTSFCAGYERGLKDGCTGDSGGPLICFRDNTWYIQGISSWGYGCAEQKWPGIYTEVNKYTSWIYSQIRNLRKGCAANPIIG
ncbi:hypothetical protein RRG08_059228 [Elysia crispata]|uniref:Peptidase S1 domain-containing protein n=1 Tax=Elysia crispata TaxID=231223 RepID=A0AAE0ZFC4_9GAST|nr:hypothetical protein RRG08_059228 [Elysia crispata]